MDNYLLENQIHYNDVISLYTKLLTTWLSVKNTIKLTQGCFIH